MKFWQNVLKALEARHMSVRALALGVGVTPGAMSRYSHGSMPSVDVAARIAKRLGLSLDSLVWGNGEDELAPICDSPGEHALLRELTEELGIQELLRVAELATQAMSWEIMEKLGYHHPKPLSVLDLCRELDGASESSVRLTLLALRKQGLVLETPMDDGEALFGVNEPVAYFKVREIGDVSQHVKRTLRILFQSVLPALERQDGTGHLVTMRAKVPLDIARKVALDMKETLKNHGRELGASTGETDLDILFAVALSDRSR